MKIMYKPFLLLFETIACGSEEELSVLIRCVIPNWV